MQGGHHVAVSVKKLVCSMSHHGDQRWISMGVIIQPHVDQHSAYARRRNKRSMILRNERGGNAPLPMSSSKIHPFVVMARPPLCP